MRRMIIFSFFKKRKVNPKEKLREVLKGYRLPSFPAVITEAMEKIRDPNSSASDIARIIALDPGISVRVLSMANSAAFSPTKQVENLNQAVALIGLAQMETLLLSAVVSVAAPRKAANGYVPPRFWLAAARRGILARTLGPAVRRVLSYSAQESEVFTAGFLQDMAIPFLAQAMPEDYGKILDRWHAEGGRLDILEREAFDWDHAEVATWICHHWRLPENIASAIGGHHDPQNKLYSCPPPVALVSLLREEPELAGLEDLQDLVVVKLGISQDMAIDLVKSGLDKASDLARLIV